MAGYVTQRRPIQVYPGHKSLLITPSGVTSETVTKSIDHLQETMSFRTSFAESQTNKEIIRSSKYGTQTRYDNGHDFRTVKAVSAFNTDRLDGSIRHQNGYTYISTLVPSGYLSDLSSISSWSQIPNFSSISSIRGNKAIKETIPSAPSFSLSNALGELLKDGLPSLGIASATLLMRDKASFFKSLGSQYLNAQFGWVPFARDIANLAFTIVNAQKVLEQYQRDANKLVRRGFGFPRETTVKTLREERVNAPYQYATGGDPLQSLAANVSYLEKRTSDVYFRGAYSYALPSNEEFFGITRFYRLAQKLTESELTPEVLWNLAPWSWPADWFGNLGDIISVGSRLQKDSVVLQYGYIMRKYEVTRTYAVYIGRANLSGGGTLTTNPRSARITVTSKERVRAEPYGFGFNPDSLSLQQWAILGALGASRS